MRQPVLFTLHSTHLTLWVVMRICDLISCLWSLTTMSWPLIGQYWSRDHNTFLWLVTIVHCLHTISIYNRTDFHNESPLWIANHLYREVQRPSDELSPDPSQSWQSQGNIHLDFPTTTRVQLTQQQLSSILHHQFCDALSWGVHSGRLDPTEWSLKALIWYQGQCQSQNTFREGHIYSNSPSSVLILYHFLRTGSMEWCQICKCSGYSGSRVTDTDSHCGDVWADTRNADLSS